MKHGIRMTVAACAMTVAVPAAAEVTRLEAEGDVAATMDALAAAVENAGATIFARVDHAGGAESVEMELAPMQLLIFGNPALGTPALQDDPLAGLELPLRVLVYEDGEGRTWIAYENPADMLGDLNIPEDADYLDRMSGALGNLAGAAASGGG